MSEHSYYAYGEMSKPWWERRTVFGLTKNHLVFVALALIIVAVFFRLDWNWIFGLR